MTTRLSNSFVSLAVSLAFLPTTTTSAYTPTPVTIAERQLLVNGEPFMVRGVGYGAVPICADPANPPYGDYFTAEYSEYYERDLQALRTLGANAVRLWGWDNAANHTDYLDKAYNGGQDPVYVIVGFWIGFPFYPSDISDPDNRKVICDAFRDMIRKVKDHPAVLMWAFGNELNASQLYDNDPDLPVLINECVTAAHDEDGLHPVVIPLMEHDGDFVDIVRAWDPLFPDLDIWGANIYRGQTFGDLFDEYKKASTKPLLISEYGIDSYDYVHCDEYEQIGPPCQAIYAATLWQEIEDNASVCCGGSIMEYRDELWKGRESSHPDQECPDSDPCAHSPCGYEKLAHPDHHSDEEWWGIMRAVENENNQDILEPRAAYAVLRSLWTEGFCEGQVTFLEPPNNVVDARQPHPPSHDDLGSLQGIDEIRVRVERAVGADQLSCWLVAETDWNHPGRQPSYPSGFEKNGIVDLWDEGDGTYVLSLKRPITPGEVTTVTYVGQVGNSGVFKHHPANVNADSASAPSDILSVIDYINRVKKSPWGVYSEDVDHSGMLGPPDILRVIDLLNGAGAYASWLDARLPQCGFCCP